MTFALRYLTPLDLSTQMHYISPKREKKLRTDTLQIRLQPREKQAFEVAARLAGIPLSAWVRERLRRVAIRELEDVGHSIPFLEIEEHHG